MSQNNEHRSCLNIGCGLSVGDHWVSVDASYSMRLSRLPLVGRVFMTRNWIPKWPPSVVYGDIVKGIKDIAPGTCDLVFASHVLEHLPYDDCYRVLSNVYAYLHSGGYFRCIVPDLETYARRYLDLLTSGGMSNAPMASHEFMRQTTLGEQRTRSSVAARIKQAFSNAHHQWMWDRSSLSYALYRVGFRDVKQRGFGEWVDERFAEVEEKGRHKDAICLEAWKPLRVD